MSGTAWLIILAVVVVACFLAFKAGRRHRDRTVAYAASRDWSIAPRDDSLANLAWGEPFGMGSDRHGRFVMTGLVGGHQMLTFEYVYKATHTGGSGGDSAWAVYSVRGQSPLPFLHVRKRSAATNAAGALGFDGVKLESEAFNSTYVVESGNPRLASALLTPQVMEWMLARDVAGFAVRGPNFVLIERGLLAGPRIDKVLDDLVGIVDRVPHFLWREYAGG